MARGKTRAEKDAESLAALEEEQRRIDAGEVDLEALGLENPGMPPSSDPDPALALPPPRVEEQKLKPGELEELQHQLANMKRTLSFYEQELNPAQKRAQQLERENEELRTSLAAMPKVPEGPTDYGLTDEEKEFETVTKISEKVAKAQNAKILRELDSFKATLKQFEDARVQFGQDAKVNEHRTALTKALEGQNPDELFGDPRILAWAEKQSEEEVLALRNPIMYSTKFVASVLTRFKAEVVKGQAVRKPSQGELAVPDRVAPDAVVRTGGAQDAGPVFNQNTFQADVHKLITNGRMADAQKLIEAGEKAMSA